MAELKIWWTDLKEARRKGEMFRDFAAMQAKRLSMGSYRYDKGNPTNDAKYLTRAKAELEEYEKTGNWEHLLNCANYCFLERVAPEHENSHFEHQERSVTRHKLGMKL